MSIFDDYRKKLNDEEEKKKSEKNFPLSSTSNTDKKQMNSLLFDTYRNEVIPQAVYKSQLTDKQRQVYENTKANKGVYSSPYLKSGREGKSDLVYGYDEWNKLDKEEKEKWFDYAEQNKSKKGEPWQAEYAREILAGNDTRSKTAAQKTSQFLNRLSDGLLPVWENHDGIPDTIYDIEEEKKWMWASLPEEVQNSLRNAPDAWSQTVARLTGKGEDEDYVNRYNNMRKAEEYLNEHYSKAEVEMLKKYAEMVEDLEDVQTIKEIQSDLMAKDPIYATVVAPIQQIGADIGASALSAPRTLWDLATERGNYSVVNPYKGNLQKAAEAGRGVQQEILEGLEGNTFMQNYYSTSVSTAESAMRLALARGVASGLTSTTAFSSLPYDQVAGITMNALMFPSVVEQTATEMVQKGMPANQAIAKAVSAGIFECLFETVSFDKLGFFQEKPIVGNIKTFAANLLKSGFVEGSEEVATDIANELYDYFAAYDYSDFKAYKDKLEAQTGEEVTDLEAWDGYKKEFADKLLKSFIGGAVSGLTMGAASNAQGIANARALNAKGETVSDADAERMRSVVDNVAAYNPNVRELMESTMGNETTVRGAMADVIEQMEKTYIKSIEKATTEKQLNTVMENLNTNLNGLISENAFNAYNAKLIELGKEGADYQTFLTNRDKGNQTTFSDLAYGTGDNYISRQYTEAKNEMENAMRNTTNGMNMEERIASVERAAELMSKSQELAEDIVAKYGEQGKTLDSPELRKYVGILGEENAARALTLGKLARESNTENVNLKGGKVYELKDTAEIERMLGKGAAEHLKSAEYNEVKNNPLFRVVSVMTGANVAFYASDQHLSIKNGAYDPKTNTFYFDANAGTSGTHAALGEVISHELTHWIRANNEAGYDRLYMFVRKDMGEKAFDSLVKEHMDRLGLDTNVAAEEVVAEACQRMLSSSETFMRYAAADTEGAKSLLSRLKNFIKKLRNAFRGSLNNEATRLINDYESLAAEWERALNEAIANGSQIAAEGIIENNPSVAENIVGTELVTKESTKSSQRLNNELMERAKKEFAKVGRDLGISYQDFYRAIALCNTIANRMLDPNDLAYYLPEDNPGKVEVGNASYGRSMENAMECIRSIVNNDFTDMVSEAVGRPLTVEEQLVASQILQIVNSRPECNYCYVATDRRAYRASFGTYFKQYEDVYNKVAKNREAFSKDLNGAEKRMEEVKVDGGEKNLGKGVVAKTYAEFLNGRKNTPDMRKRFLGWVNSAVKGEMPISRRDLTSARVRDKAREDAAKKWFINDAEKYAQSATWAKKVSRVIKVGGKNYVAKYVSYNGSILKWNQTLIDKLNEEFGLRMYSFSDYVPAFILENMQMIIDASLRGLKVLAYTKDCGFAEAFAETGAGINISLFGTLDKKAYKDENLNALREAYKANKNDATRKAYLDALNQYVVRDGIGGKDGMMGANWDRASALRKTYKNVGTVFVATNDDLVEWALANPEIDVVIPYHLVRTGEEVAAFFDYKNFKAQQEDKKTKAWTSANLKSIPPTVHGNDLATYKQALKDNNLEPRFADFIDNPNYMKLVNETRLSYKEMSPVQPIFDQSIIEREVGRIKDEGQYGLMPGFKTKAEQDAFIENQNLVGQAVDAIVEWNESGKKPIDDTKYSTRDSEGRELSEGQQEYFKDSKVRDENGNLLVMYHGTDPVEEFHVFSRGKEGILGSGIYLTNMRSTAQRYAQQYGREGKIYSVYADVKNPYYVYSDNPAREILGEKVAASREKKNSFPTKWISKKDIEKLIDNGYDGIIWDYNHKGKNIEVSVFNSNQIKNIDNLNPTSSEDIRYSTRDSEVFGQDWKPLPKEYQDFLRGSNATVYNDGKARTYDGSNHLYKLVFAIGDTYYGRQLYYLRTVNPWVASEHSDEFVGKKMAELNNLAERIKSDGYDSIVMDMYGEIPGLNNERIMHDDVYLFDDSNRMEVPQIKEEEETPQKKVVTKNTDNEGNKLSAAQKKFFANSKVRDENGNLKVMYHGATEGGFFVFDPSFSDDKTSLFFTDSLAVARTYTNMNNVFSPERMTVKKINKKIKEYGGYGGESFAEENGKYVLKNDGRTVYTYDTIDEAYFDIFGNEYDEIPMVDGFVNYGVYLNITNPLTIDAEGNSWKRLLPDGASVGELKHDDGKWSITVNGKTRDLPSSFSFEKFAEENNSQDLVYALNAGIEIVHSIEAAVDKNGNIIPFETTRDVAGRAKKAGYDGVIFNNILDTNIGGSIEDGLTVSTVAVAFSPNQVKSINNTNPTSDEDIRYSLRSVPAVEPTTDEWERTHDTASAMKLAAEKGVKMWDVSADYSGVANATQMAASYTSEKMLGTTNTYKKVFEYLGKGYDGRILDASSGMGYGTRLGRDPKRFGLNITDIEPYPHESRYQFLSDEDEYDATGKDIVVKNPRHPDYMDYEELDRLVKSGEVKPFDFIISNAVLNVLPQDLRDSLVKHMGDLLAENGQMFINVRKVDEIRKLANNPKNVKLGDHEAVESNNGNYQYGFSEPELVAYISDALGDGYTVVDGRKLFGTTSPTVLVTKKTSDIRYSTRDSEGNTLTESQAEYFSNSKIRDAEGNLKVVYHGTEADFNIFDFSQGGKNGTAEGFGIYLTDNKDVAKAYGGRIIKSYVNITKPAMFNKKSITSAQLVKLIETTAKNQAQRMIEEEGYGTLNDALKDTWISNYTYTYDKSLASSYREVANSIIRMSDNDRDIIQEVMAGMAIRDYDAATDFYKVLQSVLGFDGFVTEWRNRETGERSEIILAFNSNQVKNTDNLNPTSSDDIRFSYRDLANSESEILINALKNDAELVDELGAKQSIEAYAREYNRLKEMENQQIEITKQLRKKDTSPSEREVLLKKMVRLDRAILNKTTELTEMRNQRVIRDLLISEWDKRDTLVAAGRAEERYLTRKALEEKYGKELSSLKEKNRQKIKDIRERSEANKRKESIIKNTKKLMDMMLHPTDKKHIPSVLIEPLTEMLDGIDYWTPKEGRNVTQRQMRLRERFLNFKEAVERYMKLGEISDESKITAEMRADLDDYFGDTLDAEFLERIDELIEHTKNIDSVNDMSVEDLIDLDRTIREILKKINDKNQLISESKYQTIKELRDATVDHLNTLKTVSGSEKGNIRQRTNAGMADSYAFARYAGAGAEEVVDMLSKSFEHKIAQVKEAVEFTQGMLEPYKKQVSDWSKKKVDITLTAKQTEGNDKGKNVVVKMTVGQMMELYLLSKRKQARGHIFSEEGGSGIHLEDRNGKWTAEIPFTYADFETVMRHLRSVPGALKVADALQNYGATTITNWGNLASERMYGFEQFTDPDYWQIRTTGSNRGDTPNSEGAENAQLYKMKNYGRTKEVVANANSAINIGDAFDTWSKTIDEMTSYSSVLPAVTDALRWWNSRVSPTDGTRVKKLLADKLGKDMANVFKDTIIALNGGIMGSDSLDSIVRKLTGKAKAAAVAGNLRVVLQQPTAWTRALAEIEPQYLLKGLVMKPSVKEMQEHSAIAWHKAQGFYSNGLAPSLRKLIIGDASIGETLTEKSLWLAGKADDVTWGSLWNASKAKVEAENKALKKGSDAYWKEVNRVFSNIINNTQVVDTPLTKSTWMRGNGASMFFTAFMAEPTKTYSMVMTRLENAIRNPKDAKAWKAFCGVFAVFGLNAVVNAFAQAIADAARDDDKEKDYWEKYLEKFKGDIVDNVIPLNYIPVIKDAVSIAQGYRSNNNLATQSLNNVWNAYQDVKKAHDGKTTKTLFGTTESVAKAVSSVTGVPFGNVMRIFNSVGNVMGVDTFRRKKYTNSELGRNVVLSIEEGDTAAAEKYMKELLKNCKDDQDKANNYVITYLSEHSEEIDAWADKYMEDATKINSAIVSMRSKYSPEIIMKAIRKSINNEIEDDDDKLNLKTLADSQYTSDDINRMLEKGKIAKAYEIVDAVNEKYKKLESDSNAEDYVVDYLAENDRDIQTWAKKYMDDPTTIDDAVEAMSKKYSRDVVMKAIRKSVNNGLKKDDKLITKTLADSHYTSDDINRMLEKGKISEAQEMIDEVNAYYKKMDSKSTAKNVVTAYWKEKYLAATGADRDRIARMLYRLKNNGKQMFSSKDLQKWVSDAKEKAEKAKK